MLRPTTGRAARASASVKYRGIESDRDRLFLIHMRVVGIDVLVQNTDELGYDGIPAERGGELAIHVNRGDRLFESARQGDAEISVLRFAGAVDDAAHHRNLHLFHALVLLFPD